MEEPVKVEDVLKDKVIETTFPNIQRLLKIYICIPQSEAVVEHEFLKMNLILTKKQSVLDNGSLDALMRLCYGKTELHAAYKIQEITPENTKKTGIYFLLSYKSDIFTNRFLS